MHEVGLAREVLRIALERAAGAPLVTVVVAVGALALVEPASLAFAFEALAAGTAAADARLEIVRVPGRARCPACARVLELDRPYGTCCGRSDLEWISGHELTVRSVEVLSCA